MRRAGQLGDEGNAVDDGDVIVGSTADVADEPVLTRNVNNLDSFGVDVQNY